MHRLFPVAAALALVACKKNPPDDTMADNDNDVPTQPADTPRPSAVAVVTSTQLDLDPTLREACGITESHAFFDTNETKIEPGDKDVLKKVADCVKDGPLKDRELAIVGGADPRGSYEYNMQLGESRAQSVANYLRNRGVAEDRIVVDSVGEKYASSNPSEWAYDRRVELGLLDDGSGMAQDAMGPEGGGTVTGTRDTDEDATQAAP